MPRAPRWASQPSGRSRSAGCPLSFTRKAGHGVGGAVAAFTIGLGGYVAGAPGQSAAAENSIRIAAGAIPGAVILAATAVMLAYPLTEKAFRGLVAEMAERRAAAEAGRVRKSVGVATSPGPDGT